jgi:hypothetical protein
MPEPPEQGPEKGDYDYDDEEEDEYLRKLSKLSQIVVQVNN